MPRTDAWTIFGNKVHKSIIGDGDEIKTVLKIISKILLRNLNTSIIDLLSDYYTTSI